MMAGGDYMVLADREHEGGEVTTTVVGLNLDYETAVSKAQALAIACGEVARVWPSLRLSCRVGSFAPLEWREAYRATGEPVPGLADVVRDLHLTPKGEAKMADFLAGPSL